MNESPLYGWCSDWHSLVYIVLVCSINPFHFSGASFFCTFWFLIFYYFSYVRLNYFQQQLITVLCGGAFLLLNAFYQCTYKRWKENARWQQHIPLPNSALRAVFPHHLSCVLGFFCRFRLKYLLTELSNRTLIIYHDLIKCKTKLCKHFRFGF